MNAAYIVLYGAGRYLIFAIYYHNIQKSNICSGFFAFGGINDYFFSYHNLN